MDLDRTKILQHDKGQTSKRLKETETRKGDKHALKTNKKRDKTHGTWRKILARLIYKAPLMQLNSPTKHNYSRTTQVSTEQQQRSQNVVTSNQHDDPIVATRTTKIQQQPATHSSHQIACPPKTTSNENGKRTLGL